MGLEHGDAFAGCIADSGIVNQQEAAELIGADPGPAAQLRCGELMQFQAPGQSGIQLRVLLGESIDGRP